jgi:hypothetical protein
VGILAPVGQAAISAACAVDFVSLPRMPGAKVLSLDPAILIYEAPGDPARALIFCAKVLVDAGWCESRDAGPEFVSDDFASGYYEKSGYSLAFTARPAARKRGAVTITLENRGNLDTRTLPRLRDATLIWSTRPTTAYATSSDVSDAADFTRDALASLGWNDYALVESRRDERHELQTFQFAKDAILLKIRVSLALTPWGRNLVRYSASMR